MVEARDALLVVVVDRVEQRLAGAVVVGLQAQEARDGGLGLGRAVELEHVVEVGDQAPLGLAVGEVHRGAALDPVLALDRLLLGDPVAGVLVECESSGGWRGRRGRTGGDAALGDDREGAQEAEHDDEAGQAGTDDPAVLVSVGCRHAVTAGIRRADTLLDSWPGA